jgi:hypothetical protein
MAKPNQPETPKFLFERKAELEAAHHWALAGVLTVDIRKTPNVKRHQQAIDAIVAKLLIAATTGTLPGKGDARRMAGEGGRRGRAEDLD